MADDPQHQQALDRFTLGIEAIQPQYDREIEDLKFQVAELQWPADVRNARSGTVIGGVAVPPRPMLSIPMLDQPIQLVLNQEKAAHLGVQIHPLSEDADDDTAEIIQGLYRAIERNSRASLARSWAFDRAVKCGRGAYRVLTEYCEYTGNPAAVRDQDIVIKRLLYQEAAVFDPFAQEPDWSDGEWAFVTEWIPAARYKRLFGASALAKASSDDLREFSTTAPGWIRGDGESEAYLVAEYFYIHYETTIIGDPADPDLSREVEKRSVKWRKMNATEFLGVEQRIPGKFIPLVPVIGKELQPFDGERRWAGIYTNSKDGARLFNYAASNLVEKDALETKAPYIGMEGQFEGHEQQWNQANIRNFPYLEYRKLGLGDHLAPPPQRTPGNADRLTPSILMLQQAERFIHSTTGAFSPTLGDTDRNVKTKGGTLALQAQHELGNSHFLANLADTSMSYETKVVISQLAEVYDRPGRIVQTLDLEDNQQPVMLNQAFTIDPQTKRPIPAQDATAPDVKTYDLSKGIYGVSVTIGKAYPTRVAEGNDQLGQVIQAAPELFQVLGDIWLKFQDWPGHTEAAERVKKMLPPQLQDKKGPDATEQDTAALQAQLQQMQQVIQQQAQLLETDKLKLDAQVAMAGHKDSTTLEKTRMDNETKLAVAALSAQMDRLTLFLEERERLGVQEHELSLSAAQAGHERDMADQARQEALEQADMDQSYALEQGQQGQQFALEQGDQGHQQTLEQIQATPKPTAGGSK